MTDTPARAAVRSIVEARKSPAPAPRKPEVILRTRLPGGMVEVIFDGPEWGSKQNAALRYVLEIMEEGLLEHEHREPLIGAAATHEPEPRALSRRLGSNEP